MTVDRDQLLILIGALAALKADWTNLRAPDEHVKIEALANTQILSDLLIEELRRLDTERTT
jgi:hypothetical protein